MSEIEYPNMNAAIASREMAESFINADPEGKATYDALRERGLKHGDARNEIARVLLAVTWTVSKQLIDPGKANEVVLYPALRRVAAGEGAAELFHDGWRGEPL
jgi:hypothetical protein